MVLKGWKVLVIGAVVEATEVETDAYRLAGEERHVRIAGGGTHAALVSTKDADRAQFRGAR